MRSQQQLYRYAGNPGPRAQLLAGPRSATLSGDRARPGTRERSCFATAPRVLLRTSVCTLARARSLGAALAGLCAGVDIPTMHRFRAGKAAAALVERTALRPTSLTHATTANLSSPRIPHPILRTGALPTGPPPAAYAALACTHACVSVSQRTRQPHPTLHSVVVVHPASPRSHHLSPRKRGSCCCHARHRRLPPPASTTASRRR